MPRARRSACSSRRSARILMKSSASVPRFVRSISNWSLSLNASRRRCSSCSGSQRSSRRASSGTVARSIAATRAPLRCEPAWRRSRVRAAGATSCGSICSAIGNSTVACTSWRLCRSEPPGHAGQVYYERKRSEGKTHREAIRALKRQLATVVYHRMKSAASVVAHAT
jgi:hypothetical protein